MIVHFIKEDALEALRTNLHANLKHYAEPTNEWIYEYFGDENPFGEFKIEFPDFKLKYDDDLSPSENDVANIITLYSSMKHLTDTQATDERLWAGLCHNELYSYLHTRWKYFNLNNLKENTVKSRYFFAHNKKRSLLTNSISRLWWVGRLTYDVSRSDPFELTKFFNDSFVKIYLAVFSSNYMCSHSIASGLLGALLYLKKINYCLNNNFIDGVIEATKYLNIIGGTYILDYFSSQEISEKVITHMKSLSGAQFDT